MIISNAINFDNTKSIQNFARTAEAEKILNNSCSGNETQLYNLGDTVKSMYFDNGKIIDIYVQNGFYYYVCEYKLKPKARKTFTKTLRTKDINN